MAFTFEPDFDDDGSDEEQLDQKRKDDSRPHVDNINKEYDLCGEEFDSDYNPIEGPEGEKTEPLVVVSREEWGAIEPKFTVPMKLPVKRILYTFTTRKDSCETREECIKVVQEMQKQHMEVRGFSDIAYNFLVGGDGIVYEGRGWHVNSSRKLKFNPKLYSKRIDIAFIGDYSTEMSPPVNMWESALNLGIFGMENNFVREPYRVINIRNWKIRMKQFGTLRLIDPNNPDPAPYPQDTTQYNTEAEIGNFTGSV